MTDPEDETPQNYSVVLSDRLEVDRDGALLWIMRFLGPEYAAEWDAALDRALVNLADFPGPRAHVVDEEASVLFGRRYADCSILGRKVVIGCERRTKCTTPSSIRLLWMEKASYAYCASFRERSRWYPNNLRTNKHE